MFEVQVSELRDVRQLGHQLQDEVDESYEEWRAQNESIIACLEQAKMDQREIEGDLRAAIVQHYQETGNKKPHPKLGVRVSEVPAYEGGLAYDFALHFVPDLLKLDTRAFESYAKGVRASVPLTFVEWEEKVIATIAKSLEE